MLTLNKFFKKNNQLKNNGETKKKIRPNKQFHPTEENLFILNEEILTENFVKIQKWISSGINLDEKVKKILILVCFFYLINKAISNCRNSFFK